MRPDIGLDELYALIVGTSRGAVVMALGRAAQRRMLDVVFAGLRPVSRMTKDSETVTARTRMPSVSRPEDVS